MSVVLLGSTSGSVTLQEPAVAGSTVVNLPSTIGNASTSAMVTTDASGNVGLNVTPSTWGSTWRALNIGSAGNGIAGSTNSGQTFLTGNAYYDGSNWKYGQTNTAGFFTTSGNVHTWATAASGTAGNTISFTTAMTLNANGALALQGASTSANGVGITFPATQSASSDVNTLDDYEEGTFTPAMSCATGGPIVLSAASGRYTKVGNVVNFALRVTASNVSSAGGQIKITGLPFVFNTGLTMRLRVVSADVSNVTGSTPDSIGGSYVAVGSTEIFILTSSGGNIVLTNSSGLDFNGTYFSNT